MVVGDVYDRGAKELGKYKYGKPVSQYMKDSKGSNVKRITGMTGVGLRVAGDGKMKSAVVRHDVSKLKHGNGLRMSGAGKCEMCGGGL